MKRWALFLVLLLVCSVTYAAPKVLFEEDFTSELDAWLSDSDAWTIEEGSLMFPSVGFGDIFAGDEDWEDYIFEVDVMPLEYGQYGSVRLFFRMNELWNGYGLAIHPDGFMVHRFDGNWDKHLILSNEANPKFPPNTTVHIKIEVKKNTIKISTNDKVIFEGEDPDDVYFAGMIGFRADHSAVKISKVKVSTL